MENPAEQRVGYQNRIAVPTEFRDWTVEWPEYNPVDFTDEVVLTTGMQQGWADPEDPWVIDYSKRPSCHGPYPFNMWTGRPLNPMGRQGIAGRGLLGKWGPNNAADPIVVAVDPQTEARSVFLIRRKDTGEWAFPGGMVDPGEHVSLTAKRELREEADIDLAEVPAEEVYAGYVDDPRNTDNAWMETNASLLVISHKPQATIDEKEVSGSGWFDASSMEALLAETGGMYASHADIMTAALQRLDARQQAVDALQND